MLGSIESGCIFLSQSGFSREYRRFLGLRRSINSFSHRYHSKPHQILGIGNLEIQTDLWYNIPEAILPNLSRKLHLQPSHPISITRQLIENHFQPSIYTRYNNLSPVVTTAQNFDSLGFPSDHPGRRTTDTYYLNASTCLRTHTSAHQTDAFRANLSDGYVISADVYRRDAVDRSHYPIFHQMEGARTWDLRKLTQREACVEIDAETADLTFSGPEIEDTQNPTGLESNPLQDDHPQGLIASVSAHLKRTLENVFFDIFSRIHTTAIASGDSLAISEADRPIRLRWVDAFFPFTSPSWELEVFWRGSWLELLGCGIVRQSILNTAGLPFRVGWAFGLGLERVAMPLFSIPDIRLFWSQDERFTSQFNDSGPIKPFVSFSKYPASRRDVSFWVPFGPAFMTGREIHENNVMEVIRHAGGNIVEDVRLADQFKHPLTGRKSYCYSVTYRSLERAISREETNRLHESVCGQLQKKLGIELRV